MTRLDELAVPVAEFYRERLGLVVVTENTAKVNVVLSGESDSLSIGDPGLTVLYVHCPHHGRMSDNVSEVRRAVLETLHNALLWAAGVKSWQMQPFLGAYEHVRQHDCVYRPWALKKAVRSPDRRLSANCRFEYLPNAIEPWLVVTNRAGDEVFKAVLPRTFVHYGMPRKMIEGIKWTNNRRVRVLANRSTWTDLPLSFIV